MRPLRPGVTGWVKRLNPRAARKIFESLIIELNPRVESAYLGPTRESDSLGLDPNSSHDKSGLEILRLRVRIILLYLSLSPDLLTIYS